MLAPRPIARAKNFFQNTIDKLGIICYTVFRKKRKGNFKMYTLSIYTYEISDYNRLDLYISGCEAAYAAFHKACELADLTGAFVSLWDSDTGEIVADNGEDE